MGAGGAFEDFDFELAGDGGGLVGAMVGDDEDGGDAGFAGGGLGLQGLEEGGEEELFVVGGDEDVDF